MNMQNRNVAIIFSADHVHPKNKGNAKCISWPISAKSTSFSTEIIRFFFSFYIFFCFRLSKKKHEMAQMVRKILSLD